MDFIKFCDEDLKDLVTYWNTMGDPDSLMTALNQLQPTINTAIKSFAEGSDNPAIKHMAKGMAIKALKTYDPDKGAKVETYVFNQLQPLRREYRDMAAPLKVPDRSKMEIARMRQVEGDYEAQYGVPPSKSQLADLTGFSLKKIEQLQKIARGVFSPELVKEDQRGVESYAVDHLADIDNYWPTYIYQSLSPQDQKIYDYRTGAHGTEKLPNKEIAKKLGISAPAVSQRANFIAKQLQEGL